MAKEKQDKMIEEEHKREKYNTEDIFKNRKNITQNVQEQLNDVYNENLPKEVKKQNIFQKLLGFIRKLVCRN